MKNLFRKKINFNYAADISPSVEKETLREKVKLDLGNGLHFLTSKIKGLKNIGKRSKSEGSGNSKSGRKFKEIVFSKNTLAILTAVIISAFLLPKLFSQTPTSNEDDERISVLPAKAEKDVNKTFYFPLKDESDEQVGQIEYAITKAELLDELVVQGKRATAIEGRTFLIVSLKIKNELNQSLNINTKDYVRLSTNGNREDWLAPDIHNDPVEVQAISTKNTRVGFPINDTDKDLILRVGEIRGEKEEVPIEF